MLPGGAAGIILVLLWMIMLGKNWQPNEALAQHFTAYLSINVNA